MEPSDLLSRFVGVLDALAVRYRVVGSMASTTYGEPRFTNDLDVVVDLPPEAIDSFCRSFPSEEFYCYPEAVREAVRRRHQFNIIHYESGFKIDVFIPEPGREHEAFLARGQRIALPAGSPTWFASAEDVILKKLEYFREGGSEKHVRDIAGILRVQAGRIDRDFIADAARVRDLTVTWTDILQRIEGP
jgi:hypothetical protein